MRKSITTILATCLSSALAADPVFTFGPASDYSKSPAVTAATSPTSNTLLITPTDVSNGIPEEGMDFFLGPDLQASLKKTLDGVCADGKLSKECVQELSVALDQDNQFAIESRVVGGGLLLGAFGAVIVSLAVGLFERPQPQLSHVHLPSSDISQIQSLAGSTAVVATAATATGTANYITVTKTPTMKLEPATITTLSADDQGHHKGDVLIALPSEPADLLAQVMRRSGQPGSCKSDSNEKAKRASGNGPNLNAVTDLATFVLPMAAPGQLLRGLALQAQDHVPQLKAAIDQASLEAVQKAAAASIYFKDVAVGLRDLIAEAVWVAAYDYCFLEQVDLSTLVLEDSLISDDPNNSNDDDDDDNDRECATDTLKKPICNTPECSGSNGICQNEYKGCSCLKSVQFQVYHGDRDFMDKSYEVLEAMYEKKDDATDSTSPKDFLEPFELDGGELACRGNKDYGNPSAFFTLDAINAAAEDFCKDRVAAPFKWSGTDIPTTEEGYHKVLMKEAGDSEVLVSMTWTNYVQADNKCPELDMGSSNALKLCKDRFAGIINTCDTSNVKNVERWKQGGYYDKDCVHWYIGPQTS